MHMHMCVCVCHRNPNSWMLMRKQDWEKKPKGKIEVFSVMSPMYVDEKAIAQQKVGAAAERCDFCREKTRTVWVAVWPLLDPVSQKVLCPMLRRAAVPVFHYQCPWDQHQRGSWGEVVIREETIVTETAALLQRRNGLCRCLISIFLLITSLFWLLTLWL